MGSKTKSKTHLILYFYLTYVIRNAVKENVSAVLLKFSWINWVWMLHIRFWLQMIVSIYMRSSKTILFIHCFDFSLIIITWNWTQKLCTNLWRSQLNNTYINSIHYTPIARYAIRYNIKMTNYRRHTIQYNTKLSYNDNNTYTYFIAQHRYKYNYGPFAVFLWSRFHFVHNGTHRKCFACFECERSGVSRKKKKGKPSANPLRLSWFFLSSSLDWACFSRTDFFFFLFKYRIKLTINSKV